MHPFDISRFRLTLEPQAPLVLPAGNAANVIRGAFGTIFRQQVCQETYARVFEPSPPADSPVLSKLESIPRGFVFRAPLGEKSRWETGEALAFELLLFGSARQFLPCFEETFGRLAEEGFGAHRVATKLVSVKELPIAPRDSPAPAHVAIRFLTPTHLIAGGKTVRTPEFHHLFKRVRDRVNALATFYGSGQISADFAELGRLSESVVTAKQEVEWISQTRKSTRTGQRHELSGFTGECEFAGDLAPFWDWLVIGQDCHVGKHAVWGNGRYELSGIV